MKDMVASEAASPKGSLCPTEPAAIRSAIREPPIMELRELNVDQPIEGLQT
jgi:hypothetical protein